jgi:hypothetical protein
MENPFISSEQLVPSGFSGISWNGKQKGSDAEFLFLFLTFRSNHVKLQNAVQWAQISSPIS